MPIFNRKPLEAIDEDDIRALLGDITKSEGKHVDYKIEMPKGNREETKEFLADVTSFANASGGYLIYGVRETEGVPDKILGLPNVNPDDAILRLEGKIRDGIEPRIPNVSMRPLHVTGAGIVLVIHIPQSWAMPHRVRIKGHQHFYSRTSAGKYFLDIDEIRTLFLRTENIAERARSFRAERLSKIVAGETPIAMPEGAQTILHIIPFGAFDVGARFDVSPLVKDLTQLHTVAGGINTPRHNFDGLVSFTSERFHPNVVLAYLQIFRNGIIESVDISQLREGSLATYDFEGRLLRTLPRFFGIQARLGVEPPLAIMLSLVGVHNYSLLVPHHVRIRENVPAKFDRDALILPELVAEDFQVEPQTVMQPAFESIWQSAGFATAFTYDETGAWNPSPP